MSDCKCRIYNEITESDMGVLDTKRVHDVDIDCEKHGALAQAHHREVKGDIIWRSRADKAEKDVMFWKNLNHQTEQELKTELRDVEKEYQHFKGWAIKEIQGWHDDHDSPNLSEEEWMEQWRKEYNK